MILKKALAGSIYALGLQLTSDELAREQFRVILRQIPFLYSLILFNSLFMATSVASDIGALSAFAMPAFFAPLLIYRGIRWRKLGKQIDTLPIDLIRRHLRTITLAAGLITLLLGGWTTIFLTSASDKLFYAIPLFAILNTIVCAFCLLALPAATYLILLLGSACTIIAIALVGDNMIYGIAANLIMVAGFISYIVANQFDQLRRIVAAQSDMVAQRAYANHLARRDSLTNMPNRRAFLEALNELKSTRPDKPVALVMIDMNRFKPINDSYGHAAGDKLLINVGECLGKVVEKDGIVARLGGDEFAVLFTRPPGPDWVRGKVKQMLYEISKPVNLDEHEICLGAAFGVSINLHIPDDPMEMLRHADLALYEAKNSKASSISIFEGTMEDRLRRRTLIERALSDKNQMDLITLHFQPIFSNKSGELVGFEALARWDHPEIGRIDPSEFVGAAETTGMATKLTVHLFKQALATARDWPDNIRLSFNLSGSGLGTSNLDIILPKILADMDFEPSRLSVEITETALLNDQDIAHKILTELQNIGVRIALDDFGAGYASIGYLRQIRFDEIKLDGSLISNIVNDQKNRDLLIGVLYLCQAIDAKVTAEMVENAEQLALLRALPVHNIQGYLLGRPVPAAATFEQDEEKAQIRKQLFE